MRFRGNYYFLSNFYPAPVKIDGRVYSCAEAAFQALKCVGYEDQFVGLSGSEAKRLGRRLPMRPDWGTVRVEAMRRVLQQKFSDPVLMTQLRSISGIIQEDNDWGDTYWGVCRRVGENHLGKLLMGIRDYE